MTDSQADSSIDRNWDEQKIKILEKYNSLIEDDLLFADGTRDEMLKKLYTKLNISESELKKIIDKI